MRARLHAEKISRREEATETFRRSRQKLDRRKKRRREKNISWKGGRKAILLAEKREKMGEGKTVKH